MTSLIETIIDNRGVLFVTLNRPERCNAFNAEMVRDLTEIFHSANNDSLIRLIVLGGRGPIFCSGGDVDWMCQNGAKPLPERLANARLISDLFDTIDRCSRLTIAAVQGAAIGGGVGLATTCDLVVAESKAVFGTTEGRLGIVPACLGPYLTAKVGISHARRLMLSGSRIDALEAQHIGLAHSVVPLDRLHDKITDIVAEQLTVSPDAQQMAKRLLRKLAHGAEEEFAVVRQETIQILAESWASLHGQEGMKAFLAKEIPSWARVSSD